MKPFNVIIWKNGKQITRDIVFAENQMQALIACLENCKTHPDTADNQLRLEVTSYPATRPFIVGAVQK